MRWILVLTLVFVACAPRGGAGRGDVTLTDVGIGAEAVDGQFTFVVRSFECGHDEVVNGPFRQEATGEFCLLELSVTNTGREGRRYLARIQSLLNYDGGRLNPSNEATLVASPGTAGEELNPGLSLESVVVFDVADPDDIEFAVLRDAALSRGVQVRLGQERG